MGTLAIDGLFVWYNGTSFFHIGAPPLKGHSQVCHAVLRLNRSCICASKVLESETNIDFPQTPICFYCCSPPSAYSGTRILTGLFRTPREMNTMLR